MSVCVSMDFPGVSEDLSANVKHAGDRREAQNFPGNSPGRFPLLHVITCLLLLVCASLSCPATTLGHQLHLDSASSSFPFAQLSVRSL